MLIKYGYFLLILILGLDSSGVPWPTEATLVVAAAGVTGRGGSSLLQVALFWLASLAGAALGSSFSYYLGRRMGSSLLRRIGSLFHLKQEQLDKVDRWFDKHGHRAVFFGRLVPFVRNLVGYPAGVMEIPFPKYLAYSLAGYGVYIAFALSLGFGGMKFYAHFLQEFEFLLWFLIPLALLVAYVKWGRTLVHKMRGKG